MPSIIILMKLISVLPEHYLKLNRERRIRNAIIKNFYGLYARVLFPPAELFPMLVHRNINRQHPLLIVQYQVLSMTLWMIF